MCRIKENNWDRGMDLDLGLTITQNSILNVVNTYIHSRSKNSHQNLPTQSVNSHAFEADEVGRILIQPTDLVLLQYKTN